MQHYPGIDELRQNRVQTPDDGGTIRGFSTIRTTIRGKASFPASRHSGKEKTVQETPAGDEPRARKPSGRPEDPWRSLRRQQDRRRYLRILSRQVANEKPRRPDPALGVPRTHPLLGSPASVTRSGSHVPAQLDVRNYLRHSADLTMRGGNAAGLVYPLAACALAEHYVFRRIGGSSSGAMAAAATAAAELGRGAHDPFETPQTPSVVPGFGGLAQIVGWLAGGDNPTGPEQHRLARMLQPTGSARGLYRLLVALLSIQRVGVRAAGRLLLAGCSLLNPVSRALLLLIWAGLALGWLGLTSALISGSRAGAISVWVTVGASMTMLLAFGLAGLAVTVIVELVAAGGRLRSAPRRQFGLIAGAQSSGSSTRLGRWLDRRAGVPATDGMPALFTWLSDRLDDLAGIPQSAGTALTLGDLWSGSTGDRTPEQSAQLRRAAVQPEHRVINLVLVTTDLSSRRPYRLPFLAADEAERLGGARFLFCEPCLAGLLPERIITQMVKAAPSTDTDHPCPRHRTGVLRELPEPWDLPVAFAVRLSFSPPGLLRAVPLYSIAQVHRAARYDEWGRRLRGTAPARTGERTVARTHWFVDGGLTSNVPVSYFDALLPRWPTFGINLEDADPEAKAEVLRIPAQDAGPARRSWRSIDSFPDLLSTLLDSGLGWRDSAQADLPGFRGRVAMIRRTAAERGDSFLLSQRTLLALAIRGLQAGITLRDRFTGSDDLVPGQTQTDRYRWIRLRVALREYRGLSLEIGARLPLYRDLASSYHVPEALTPWFDPPLAPAERDPIWADAGSAIVTIRALSAGGVLDFDTDRGAPPGDPDLRLLPPE
jgi:predicted acylesterase/phospholipase RssA